MVGYNAPNSVGTIVTTQDGGSTWNSEHVPGGSPDLLGVSCPSLSVCYAAGEVGDYSSISVVASSDGGVTWRTVTTPTGFTQMFGIFMYVGD